MLLDPGVKIAGTVDGNEMTCRYCGTRNTDGEHRCMRCGRRPGDTLTVAPVMTGALAPKLEAVPLEHAGDAPPRPRPNLGRAVQVELFDDRPVEKIVPIARYAPRPEPKHRVKTEGTRTSSSGKTVGRKPKPVPEGQGSLDFLPPAPKPRQLGTSVDAVIYCEYPVATTLHRAVASALDWSMVLIAYGVFLWAIHEMGCAVTLTKTTGIVFGAMLVAIGFTYGLCFTLVGAETPGMHWTQLRLTTFDGFPPEKRQRLGRFLAACLSRCTVLGLLWSLADEESLSWHDHISRTFPTPREHDTHVFRRR
jgi:uncharacterized RDD family membrane protein YckC